LSSLVTVTLLVVSIRNATKYFSWKKQVNDVIEKAGSYKKVCLNANRQGFDTAYDGTLVIETWSNIKRGTVSPTHIFLAGDDGQNFLFPAKSMQPYEFEQPSQLVRACVRHSVLPTDEPMQPNTTTGEATGKSE